MPAPKLCLNMIVRNEAAILERCLASVAPYLSYYVIGDTGSSDGTIKLIERFFAAAGVPGEVHSYTFRDFSQARNQALELCRASAGDFDYILLIDADMELVAHDPTWHHHLSQPAYTVRQVSGTFSYFNLRVLARSTSGCYVGSTHEALRLELTPARLESASMLDHACGSSRPEKHTRDLALLQGDLEAKPDDARTLFYLGQTLREMGRFHEAIAMYQRRVQQGGWDEEVWYSKLTIARCHAALGETTSFVACCLEAYGFRPHRAEALFELGEHYRNAGLNDTAALFYEAGLELPPSHDVLFVDDHARREGFRQGLSISGFYSALPARRERARALCAELALDRSVSLATRDLARSNWRFYARRSDTLFEGTRFVQLAPPRADGYHPCNPSLVLRDNDVWCCLRTVSYQLRGGHYILPADGVVRTQSYLARLDAALQPVDPVTIVDDSPPVMPDARVVGLEDVRLVWDGQQLRGGCTVADRDPSWHRHLAVFDLSDDGRVTKLTLQEHENHLHQKNWMPFVDDQGVGYVYMLDPTTVLRWDPSTRQATPVKQSPCAIAFENQRGGSGLVPFDEGWLLVSHEVSWASGQRTYLHRFVYLDAGFMVQAATEAFYFRELGIEFCAGLVAGPATGLAEGELLASFGVNDGEAWLAVLDAATVRRQLRPVQAATKEGTP